MANGAVNPNGDEKYWINGGTFEGVLFQSNNIGTQKYWVNGGTEENLFPLSSNIQSSMFLIFD